MALLIILAFVLSYSLFMAFSYVVAKNMFPTVDKVVADEHRDRVMLMMKAKRVKGKKRVRKEVPAFVPQTLAHA